MRRSLILVTTAIFMCIGVSSCSRQKHQDARGLTALVSIEGSDTMTALVEAWAKKFMQSNPNVPISVNSGDSGAGIDALINRTTDLAAASRDLNQSENDAMRTKSVKLKRVTVARDSIAIVINPENQLKELTLDQLKKIFSGSTTNWGPVGGAKAPIHVLSREDDSGTNTFVRQHLLTDLPFAKGAKTMLSGKELLNAVAEDKDAIGYVGMGSATEVGKKVKILALKMSADSAPVMPTEESTVMDYPLSRPLILFMDEDPKPSVRKFVDYCLSDDAQKLVQDAGYAPVNSIKQ